MCAGLEGRCEDWGQPDLHGDQQVLQRPALPLPVSGAGLPSQAQPRLQPSRGIRPQQHHGPALLSGARLLRGKDNLHHLHRLRLLHRLHLLSKPQLRDILSLSS